MALYREQIEHPNWVRKSKTHKWMKKQMNKFLRLKNKKIEDGEVCFKRGRKPTTGWEW